MAESSESGGVSYPSQQLTHGEAQEKERLEAQKRQHDDDEEGDEKQEEEDDQQLQEQQQQKEQQQVAVGPPPQDAGAFGPPLSTITEMDDTSLVSPMSLASHMQQDQLHHPAMRTQHHHYQQAQGQEQRQPRSHPLEQLQRLGGDTGPLIPMAHGMNEKEYDDAVEETTRQHKGLIPMQPLMWNDHDASHGVRLGRYSAARATLPEEVLERVESGINRGNAHLGPSVRGGGVYDGGRGGHYGHQSCAVYSWGWVCCKKNTCG